VAVTMMSDSALLRLVKSCSPALHRAIVDHLDVAKESSFSVALTGAQNNVHPHPLIPPHHRSIDQHPLVDIFKGTSTLSRLLYKPLELSPESIPAAFASSQHDADSIREIIKPLNLSDASNAADVILRVFTALMKPKSESGGAQSSNVSEFIKDLVLKVDLDKLFPSTNISLLFGVNSKGNILYLRCDPMTVASLVKIHGEVSSTDVLLQYCLRERGLLSRAAFMAAPMMSPRLVFTGTPGIGKSFCLNLFALILIACGEPFASYREADRLISVHCKDGCVTFQYPTHMEFVRYAEEVKPENMLMLMDSSQCQEEPHNFETFSGLVMVSNTTQLRFAPVKPGTSTVYYVMQVPSQRQLNYIIDREIELRLEARLGAQPYARDLLKHLVQMIPPSLVVGPSISRTLMIVDGALDQLEAAYRALNADRGSIFTLPDAQIKDVICSAYKSRLTEFISDVIDTAASEVESTDFDWEAVFARLNIPLVYDKIKNYRKFTASCVVIERNPLVYDRPEQCIAGIRPPVGDGRKSEPNRTPIRSDSVQICPSDVR
jgi:hypothetical protein